MSATYERVNDLAEVRERRATFLAIGVFDGVHAGHQELLKMMTVEAQEEGARAAVLTFFPHPREVIQGNHSRMYLTTLEQRMQLLSALGMELIIVHPFNEEVRHTRATEFVDRLCRYLDLRALWGGSFSLGYRREGDTAFLRRLGKERGFTVHEIQNLIDWEGKPVSSSRIRQALADGDIATVNGCLKRHFELRGEVIHGNHLGHTIGFPTANLDIWERQLLPKNGVYATYAYLDGDRFLAATNVGVRPTVGDPALTVEAHLLDFDQDIYGRQLQLSFVSRARDERKFSGLDALKTQIAVDVAQVRSELISP
jgi:riboflavin kinase / FMN adenylyltransferase